MIRRVFWFFLKQRECLILAKAFRVAGRLDYGEGAWFFFCETLSTDLEFECRACSWIRRQVELYIYIGHPSAGWGRPCSTLSNGCQKDLIWRFMHLLALLWALNGAWMGHLYLKELVKWAAKIIPKPFLSGELLIASHSFSSVNRIASLHHIASYSTFRPYWRNSCSTDQHVFRDLQIARQAQASTHVPCLSDHVRPVNGCLWTTLGSFLWRVGLELADILRSRKCLIWVSATELVTAIASNIFTWLTCVKPKDVEGYKNEDTLQRSERWSWLMWYDEETTFDIVLVFLQLLHMCYRRKFRSQTSDDMDRWKAE